MRTPLQISTPKLPKIKVILIVQSSKSLLNMSFYLVFERGSWISSGIKRWQVRNGLLKNQNLFYSFPQYLQKTGMAQDIHSQLKGQMSYGTVTRSELPGDIEDYNITLIKQYYQNKPPTLKLKFTLAKKQSHSQQVFYISIDDVRDPANPLILIKYSENEGKVEAKATNKIKKKMILSVEKSIKEHQDLVEAESQEEDSDIPRGRPIFQQIPAYDGDQVDNKPRKRVKGSEQEDEYSDS